ncbi:PDZ domain-containing protein [Flavobacterium sp. 17A]|uniref:PDZ domain-containing protein n=1 Tax=Flavobacterium potami TaxID=2872310 RepID=A0A9X1H8T6_9FLAO|nr:S41 family peptidase [Flavobacterium potami]MBZ4034261.1 PDZ domain-containing protein [Flavobacterium potami]
MIRTLVFLLLVYTQAANCQNTVTETHKLAAVCKIWGFLKYYHPNVARGDFNWDKQLKDILPKIEKAKTKEEFSLTITNWIDSLGTVPETKIIDNESGSEYFDENFDLSWITNNTLFSKNLIKKMKFIEQNRFQGDQYYVSTFNAGNVFVRNENYLNFKPDSKESRILVLFMFWNVIEYFYPYKYLMDKNWDKSLEELLPVFVNAGGEEDFYVAVKRLTVRLNDSHGLFYKYPDPNPELNKNKYYFPAGVKIIEDKIVVTEILSDSIANADNIKVGDVITKVDGKNVKDIVLENKEYVNGSNEAFYLYNLSLSILSKYSESVELEFLENDNYKTRIVNLHNYHDSHMNEYRKKEKKERFKILDKNIGYVDMGLLKIQNIPSMIENLQSTKAIIFDLRNYPNSTYEELSNFLNSKPKGFAIYTRPDLHYPGRYIWKDPTVTGFENKNNYKGKVIVLVNEYTFSQSEWTAMCFKTADNTTIIGSQTAGADGNVSVIDPVKTFISRFSGIGVYYPDKKETQRIGIIPDIQIKATIKGIKEGRDEALERAILFINQGI